MSVRCLQQAGLLSRSMSRRRFLIGMGFRKDIGCCDCRFPGRFEDEVCLPSLVEFANGQVFFTSLAYGGFSVYGVEHILAALEACGVSNCRVEVEGGRELPVIDGSSSGWVSQIIRIGVLHSRRIYNGISVGKLHRPVILYGSEGNFVSLVPGSILCVASGWDGTGRGASCFGKQ